MNWRIMDCNVVTSTPIRGIILSNACISFSALRLSRSTSTYFVPVAMTGTHMSSRIKNFEVSECVIQVNPQ